MVALHEKGISRGCLTGKPRPRDGNCDYNVPIIQLDKATVGVRLPDDPNFPNCSYRISSLSWG